MHKHLVHLTFLALRKKSKTFRKKSKKIRRKSKTNQEEIQAFAHVCSGFVWRCTTSTWSISLFQPEVLFVLGLNQKWLFGGPHLSQSCKKLDWGYFVYFQLFLHLKILAALWHSSSTFDTTCSDVITISFKSVLTILISLWIVLAKRLIVQSPKAPLKS